MGLGLWDFSRSTFRKPNKDEYELSIEKAQREYEQKIKAKQAAEQKVRDDYADKIYQQEEESAKKYFASLSNDPDNSKVNDMIDKLMKASKDNEPALAVLQNISATKDPNKRASDLEKFENVFVKKHTTNFGTASFSEQQKYEKMKVDLEALAKSTGVTIPPNPQNIDFNEARFNKFKLDNNIIPMAAALGKRDEVLEEVKTLISQVETEGKLPKSLIYSLSGNGKYRLQEMNSAKDVLQQVSEGLNKGHPLNKEACRIIDKNIGIIERNAIFVVKNPINMEKVDDLSEKFEAEYKLQANKKLEPAYTNIQEEISKDDIKKYINEVFEKNAIEQKELVKRYYEEGKADFEAFEAKSIALYEKFQDFITDTGGYDEDLIEQKVNELNSKALDGERVNLDQAFGIESGNDTDLQNSQLENNQLSTDEKKAYEADFMDTQKRLQDLHVEFPENPLAACKLDSVKQGDKVVSTSHDNQDKVNTTGLERS